MQQAIVQGFRLSPQQQHVWWAQRAQPAPSFVVQVRMDLAGTLDRSRLARAVEAVAARHEILRTTFPLLPSLSVPVQSVEDAVRIDWSEVSLAGPPTVERDAALERLSAEIREAPFNLVAGPLLRVTLIQLETALSTELETVPGREERHALLLTQPALTADNVALELLADEVAAVYREAPGDEEVLQYADLAELLHEWQDSPAEDPGPAFWRQQDLSALPRVTLGRSLLPDGQSYRLERVRRNLERTAVAAAADRLGSTVFRLLLAGWHAALHLSTGAKEIVVGTLFDGRTCEELQTALGPFARYLPVRERSTADSTLAELDRSLSATVAEVSQRQDCFSFAALEALLAEQGSSGWPFGFDYRRPRELPPAAAGLVFAIGDSYLAIDRFGVRLSVLDDGQSLRADLAYDPALVPREEAVRLLERFSRVLKGLLARAALGEIDVLTESERRRLRELNRTESPLPPGLCAHHLFEASARRAPEAPALRHAGRSWTYAELDARAGRLAQCLRATDVGPGALVGVCLERSPALVEAVLAILKAGAAYVPLDPAVPTARLSWMAADAGLSLLLTQEPLDALFSNLPIRILRLGGDGGSGEGLPGFGAPTSVGPDDLAYVIYTSGSTGRPKGVMIPHRGLVNYLVWARQAYAASEGCGAPVHSAIGFDLTITSLLVPLATGTAVTLLDERRPVEALLAALRETADFSLVKLTPAHLDVLRRELRPDEYAARTRALVIGGEALRVESVAPWREHAPRTRLFNEYGPTEATVGCSVYEIAPGDAAAGPVAIGRPIANTRLYVVGPRLQPVPLGAAGELWIGGAGLAQGYLGRPELTAERFVPDLFAEAGLGGERLYRSGDLVRLRPDGQLEFLGRIDSQVKIRGHRIEPGEIEATLAGYAGVREAAVLAAEDPAGGTVLVACVAGDAEAGGLRRYLLDRLPEAMVPAQLAFFDALPLTSNGKVDRRELARTWRERAGAPAEAAGGEAPRSWTEELLAGMFAELLGVPRVGRRESFFALGGHSLLATQAVSRVREAFGVEMTLRAFFETPTVAALAGRVEALRARGETVEAPPLAPAPRSGPLPLSFAQQRLWFIDQLEPGSPLYNIPVALRVEGPLRAGVLTLCLGEAVRRHEALRTVFAVREDTPVQVVQPAEPFQLAVVDLSGLPPDRRETLATALAREEAGRPFDLSRGPLLRGLLLRISGEDHIAALTLHHIVSDGWSMGILVREVTALYAAVIEQTSNYFS